MTDHLYAKLVKSHVYDKPLNPISAYSIQIEDFNSKASEITELLYAWKNDEIMTSSETAHRLRTILFGDNQ